jgi:hypothetical protein
LTTFVLDKNAIAVKLFPYENRQKGFESGLSCVVRRVGRRGVDRKRGGREKNSDKFFLPVFVTGIVLFYGVKSHSCQEAKLFSYMKMSERYVSLE